MECPLLNITDTVRWRNRWWLLDLETSGLDRQADDIIALRLARMEDYSIKQEREILIQPRRPLSPWAERLTGISNQDLEQAVPLAEAIGQLEALDGNLLFLDQGLNLPFLENAHSRCGRAFALPCLLLDRLAALLLGCSPRQKTDRFLEKLPPPASWLKTPPQDADLEKIYALSLAVFEILERNHIQNTAQLTNFYEQEKRI